LQDSEENIQKQNRRFPVKNTHILKKGEKIEFKDIKNTEVRILDNMQKIFNALKLFKE